MKEKYSICGENEGIFQFEKRSKEFLLLQTIDFLRFFLKLINEVS